MSQSDTMNVCSSTARQTVQLSRVTRAGAPSPGFAGSGHIATQVFAPSDLSITDPFVMLMDDLLDLAPGHPIGVAHPHAGLETLTLVIEGALDDADEGILSAGDAAWMSAGRGVVHNENVRGTGHARILQLWVALPRVFRSAPPELQLLPLCQVPVRREPGAEARLYSGRTGSLVSVTRNRVPMTVVDFTLAAGASIEQELPSTQNGFIYVLDGSVNVNGAHLSISEAGWFKCSYDQTSLLNLQAGQAGARFVLYAAEPLLEPIVHHGPFVAGSQQELASYYNLWSAGEFDSIRRIAGRAQL